ncbi:MAG: hypothetical protein ABIE84_07270 [bacterium]
MRIGIDIDNVIADTYNDLSGFFHKFLKHEVPSQDVVQIMQKRKMLMYAYFFKAWREKVMLGVNLIEGARETIQEWAKEHQIILVTSRFKMFNRQTKDWLAKHQIPYHELHHAKETTKFKKTGETDLFIEDNFHECEVLADHSKKVFLFDRPWNQKTPSKGNIIRVKDWQDISHYL